MDKNLKPPKQRFQDLDDLLNSFHSAPATPDASGIAYLPISLPVNFPGHPFHMYAGERLTDMVESIKKHGIMVPIIARLIDGVYQILSGHNRRYAGELAGLTEIPCIVLENLSDEEAWAYVVETNLIQRSFSDMMPSEQAAVLAMQRDEMFSQGKRNDIMEILFSFEKSLNEGQNPTYCQVGKKLNAHQNIAQEYNLSARHVARLLRVNNLIDALKARLDNKQLPFIAAVDLSYLPEGEQELVEKCIEMNHYKLNIKNSQLLRQHSHNRKLDDDSVYLILSGEKKAPAKPSKTFSIKMHKNTYDRFFKPDMPQKEVVNIVKLALEAYFSK